MKKIDKSKLFDKATLKLTAVYTTVIMIISISFSAIIGNITVGEVKRPFKAPSSFTRAQLSDDFDDAYTSRAGSVEKKVWDSLLLINVNMLLISLGLSYLFARWTLKPIERAMDDETRFVSDASHELRTPLATMRMENEVLLRDNDAKKEEYKKQIQSNLEEIDKLRTLTDTLLKMNGSDDLPKEEVDVTEPIAIAVNRVSHAAEAKDIEIDNLVKTSKAQTNADAVAEIIYIYLDNAIKYAPEHSTVEIFCDKDSISVRDHGKGIDEKDLPHLFDRFYRADESRNSSGFGLGLSLASNLAERMGAKVSAANNPVDAKPGATFTVKLR